MKRSTIDLLAYYGQSTEQTPVVLPDGYVRLDYIECTGEQYLVLPVKPYLSWRIRGEFMLHRLDRSQFLWACRKAVGTWPYFSIPYLTGQGFRVDYGNTTYQTSTSPAVDSKFTIEQNRNNCYYNGSLINTADSASSQVDSYIIIGAANSTSVPIDYYMEGRIYVLKVWDDNGVPVADLIPGLRLSDFKPGMYDGVSGQFLTNQGTGADFRYLSAADYVQDGLVGMWDGIENAGYKQHAQDAQTWTDLAGGIGAGTLLAGTRTWTPYGLSVVGSVDRWAMPINAWFNNRNACTVETAIVTTGWYNQKGSNRILTNSESGGIIMFYNAGTSVYMAQRYAGSGYATASFSLSRMNSPLTMSLVTDASSISMGLDGEIKSTSALSGANRNGSKKLALAYEPNYNGDPSDYATYGAMSGLYNSIRLYSKALTAAELAQNYAVDKYRFVH